MDQERKTLKRWIAIEDGTGIDVATRIKRLLFVVGMCLSILILFSIVHGFHPAIVSVLSVLLGWSLAEGNALRSRIEQWPHIRKYLNWKLIRENAKHSNA